MRKKLVVFFVSLFLLLPVNVQALSCAAPSPISLLTSNIFFDFFGSDYVFTGRVTDTFYKEPDEPLALPLSLRRLENEILVSRVYKGSIKGEIIADSYFDTGGEYLFFANKNGNGDIWIIGGGPCSHRSPTMLLSDATDELNIIKFLSYYQVYFTVIVLLLVTTFVYKRRSK